MFEATTETRPNLLDHLENLAIRVARPYRALPQTRAIVSVGSLSYGKVDEFSDLDIIIFYDQLPSEEELQTARYANGAERVNWALGDHAGGEMMESYYVNGVECQFVHQSLSAWETNVDSVLVGLDVDSPLQKAFSGLQTGRALFGADLLEQLQSRVAFYPRALQKAMVEKHLSFQALWALEARLSSRDALLWRRQALIEGAQNLLGVLAGLNCLYYSTFQFKRMGDFIDQLVIRPNDLENRLTRMFTDAPGSVREFRSLVAETVRHVEDALPDIDTSRVRAQLEREEYRWKVA